MTDETDVKKMKGKNKLSRIISEKLGRVQVGCTTPQLCEGLTKYNGPPRISTHSFILFPPLETIHTYFYITTTSTTDHVIKLTRNI